MTRGSHVPLDDRGAILIHVAVSLLGLMALSMFVIDFGVFWASREQAQNSADAAAHAGALSLAFEIAANRNTIAPQTATAVAQLNKVWTAAPSVVVPPGTLLPYYASPSPCPYNGTDATEMCLRVDVYRNAAHGNPLPTFFGKLVNVAQQGVQATATAEVMPGNVSRCLKPWAVPNNYTGFADYQVDRDLGKSKLLVPPPFTPQSGAPTFLPVKLECATDACYGSAVSGCITTTFTLGQSMSVQGAPLPAVLSHKANLNALIRLDPGATFNPITKKVENSCVGGGGVPYTCSQPGLFESPRIVDMPSYTNAVTLEVTNILGAFVAKCDACFTGCAGFELSCPGPTTGTGVVTVNFVTKPGEFDPSLSKVPLATAFTRTIVLVR